jgi:hypothetical protein
MPPHLPEPAGLAHGEQGFPAIGRTLEWQEQEHSPWPLRPFNLWTVSDRIPQCSQEKCDPP